LLTKLADFKVAFKSDKDNDFVADGVTDLGKYDLDPTKKKPLLRIEVGRGESDKKLTTQAIVIGLNKKISDKYYAFAEGTGKGKDIVKIPASAVEPFRKLLEDPDSLRGKTLVQTDGFRAVDAIEVQNSYGKLEFRKPEAGKWEHYRNGIALAVDEPEVQVLVGKLTEKNAIQSFPDNKRKKELGLAGDKADATVTVWTDSLEKPEKKGAMPKFKKDVKPIAILRFGNREKESVAVERIVGKDSTLAMVSDGLLDQVRKGPLAYLDRKLPGFNPGSFDPSENVTKVALVRDKTTYEIGRDKTGGGWTFAAPKSLLGRSASTKGIEDLLSKLNNLKAVEVVAEKADASELNRTFNLKDAPLQAAVTVTPKDGKPTTTTFLFGKDSPDKKGVFFKIGGKDAVYVIDFAVADQIKKDLRDMAVIKFDPGKVKAIKFVGWEKIVGSPTTLSLERKDNKWKVVKPSSYDLDADKLQSFLDSIANLNADRFVSSGDKPRPNQELTVAKGALEIEITVEGKDKPLQLTVGGADGDKSFFATSAQLKGDIFTVSKDLFDKAKSLPAFLKK
jgi:hypothetical protein